MLCLESHITCGTCSDTIWMAFLVQCLFLQGSIKHRTIANIICGFYSGSACPTTEPTTSLPFSVPLAANRLLGACVLWLLASKLDPSGELQGHMSCPSVPQWPRRERGRKAPEQAQHYCPWAPHPGQHPAWLLAPNSQVAVMDA